MASERQRPMSLMVSLLMPAHSTQWSAWSEAGGGEQGAVDARDVSDARARPRTRPSPSDGRDRASVHVTVVVGVCAIAHQSSDKGHRFIGQSMACDVARHDLSPFEFFWSTKSSVTARRLAICVIRRVVEVSRDTGLATEVEPRCA
jgi:hypothetical protein